MSTIAAHCDQTGEWSGYPPSRSMAGRTLLWRDARLAVFREWGTGAHRGVVFFLGAGLLEVSGFSSRPPSGAVQLLLQVRDVRREWRLLAAAGVAIEEEPTAKPWGADRDGGA